MITNRLFYHVHHLHYLYKEFFLKYFKTLKMFLSTVLLRRMMEVEVKINTPAHFTTGGWAFDAHRRHREDDFVVSMGAVVREAQAQVLLY